ncbi:MAG TPA: FAD-dependent monooxygenase [Sphingomonas sp.]
MRRTAALIVGGGPAGAAAAITLAQGGTRALLLERHRVMPDSLCGGFLSWRSIRTLASLGIEADALNPNRVTRLRLFGGGRVRDVALPAPAVGVSRARLDRLLLDRAEAAGVAVQRGVTVRGIDARTATLADGTEIESDTLFLASGKHDVRGSARPAPRAADPALGLRVRLPAHPTLDRLVGDAIELHPFRGGYAGIVRQEDGSANICMALRRSRLREAGGDPAALLLRLAAEHPHLGDRIALGTAPPADAVANVPYGWRALATRPGVFRVGDQAGVIPSLAGEGMGIALATGRSAAEAWIIGGPVAAEEWQRHTARRLRRPLAIAGLLRDIAETRAAALLPWMPETLIRLSANGTRFTP